MNTVTIKLTPYQARVLWNVIDGAADAGACEGGLDEGEANALEEVSEKSLSKHRLWAYALCTKGGE